MGDEIGGMVCILSLAFEIQHIFSLLLTSMLCIPFSFVSTLVSCVIERRKGRKRKEKAGEGEVRDRRCGFRLR